MNETKFELFNNHLVQQVTGPQDCNIKLIESLLNVEVVCMGNQISIKGNDKDIKKAEQAFNILHHKASIGVEIGDEEVKAAVRMSSDDGSKIEDAKLDNLGLKTKKRHIYPRSNTQAQYIQEMMDNELV